MIDERISVNKINLESAEAYIASALKRAGNGQSIVMTNDLRRALECIADARLTDDEIREKY